MATNGSAPSKLPFHLKSSQSRIVIRNAVIVNADEIIEPGDVYVEDGIIKEIGRNLVVPGGVHVIDAKGMYVMPGGIDPHTRFGFNFMGQVTADDFYTGTRAAVAGGTTMIMDFANPQKGESLIKAFLECRQKADSQVCCDYGLHVGITSWSPQVREEMEELTKKFGANSFKILMTYNSYMVCDGEMYEILEAIKETGGVAMVHAENGSIVNQNTKRLLAKGITGPEGHQLSCPEDVEANAVYNACTIANQVKCPLYVAHVTSSTAANMLASKRHENHNGENSAIFGETLAAAVGTYWKAEFQNNYIDAAAHIMSPPLRSDPSTPKQLVKLLSAGEIDTIGSDHCSFKVHQKTVGKNDFTKIPNGVNGVEDRMKVLWEKGVNSGIMSFSRFVAVTSTNVAKIFNIYPKKGAIAVGSDADIVVWNPIHNTVISAQTHHQASDYNIFEGIECRGGPYYVIVKGKICVAEGELKSGLAGGFGEFVETPVFPEVAYKPGKKESELEAVAENISHLVIHETAVDLPARDGSNSDDGFCPSQVVCRSGKGMRKNGQRDLHSSSFYVSGEQVDESQKSSIRVYGAPGGRSSVLCHLVTGKYFGVTRLSAKSVLWLCASST